MEKADVEGPEVDFFVSINNNDNEEGKNYEEEGGEKNRISTNYGSERGHAFF